MSISIGHVDEYVSFLCKRFVGMTDAQRLAVLRTREIEKDVNEIAR